MSRRDPSSLWPLATCTPTIGDEAHRCVYTRVAATVLLFDPPPVAQSRMGLTAGFAWAPPLAGVHERRYEVEDSDEDRRRAREAADAEHRDPCDTCLGGCHDLYLTDWQGSIE
jgi:hypothetical protein